MCFCPPRLALSGSNASRYEAFGNAISGGGLEYGYTGKWQRQFDSSTGTIRMGVREYDLELGRFLSEDPLRGTPTDPQQRNRYPYVGNDPMSRYDLRGLWYIDLNINLGEEYGITGGAMMNSDGLYPYAGGGVMSSSGVSLTFSINEPSNGLNAGCQGGRNGVGLQVGEDENNNLFSELGIMSPGESVTLFYVSGPLKWGMSDEEWYKKMEEQLIKEGLLCPT